MKDRPPEPIEKEQKAATLRMRPSRPRRCDLDMQKPLHFRSVSPGFPRWTWKSQNAQSPGAVGAASRSLWRRWDTPEPFQGLWSSCQSAEWWAQDEKSSSLGGELRAKVDSPARRQNKEGVGETKRWRWNDRRVGWEASFRTNSGNIEFSYMWLGRHSALGASW